MLHKWVMITAAVISSSALGAEDYNPKFDPSRLKASATVVPNEVLVLGTSHLSSLPATFDSKLLEPLIRRLEAWKPQIITIEAISGSQCDFMRRYSARYTGSVKSYCWDPAPAHKATGLDVSAATAEVDRLLATWSSSPTPAQRRHLAAIFLAAGDRVSALVQWLRLPIHERRRGDGLDKTLVSDLQKLITRCNEVFLIAAPLAARLGLERVYPIDDHTADFETADDVAYFETVQRLWDNPAAVKRKAEDEALHSKAQSGEGVLAMYRALQ